jgi:hypothetical protein
MVGAVAVVTLDRRKLAAPLFAQAAAFVAVLVIGGFTAHTSTATPAPGASARPSARPSAAASSAVKGPTLKLTVTVVQDSTAGPSVAGRKVNVLQDGTLASVAAGPLSPALKFAANVPAGQYQVCVNPPLGWRSAVRGTHALGGWICSSTDLRTAPQLVTFRLAPQPPQVSQ